MAYKDLNVVKVEWKDIRQDMLSANKDFAELVDAWDLPQNFSLYKASYPYGQKISNKGKLNLPTKDGSVVNLHSDVVPKELQDAFSYSSLPLGFVLKNTAEVYREIGQQRISPLAFFEPGIPLGLLETLEPPLSCCVRNVWDVVAGARSIFMLAKISDGIAHKRLQKETGIITAQPKEVFDHFSVFRELYKCGAITNKWETEVLFLSGDWFKPDHNNLNWLKFYNFLHHYLFSFSGYSRNKPTIDLIWDCFCEELIQTKQRPQPYIYETVRHLFAMACAAVPGFSPAIDSTPGPIADIQRIYTEVYGLDKAPIIMAPRHFIINDKYQPVYYSINFPTRFRSIPRGNSKINLSQDIHQIRSLIEYFYVSFYDGKLKLGNTMLESVLNSVKFNYFHIEPSRAAGIMDPSKMPETDNNLLLVNGKTSSLPFKHDSQFLRGCIRISKRADIFLDKGNIPLS